MTGQDQELRQALIHCLLGFERNVKELLDALRTEPPSSQREPAQPSSRHQPTKPPVETLGKEQLLASDGGLLADVDRDSHRIAIIPKVELPIEDSTYSRFLKPKILTPITAKHPQFHYSPTISNGKIVRLELEGLTQEQWNDLLKPLAWTLEKARSTQS